MGARGIGGLGLWSRASLVAVAAALAAASAHAETLTDALTQAYRSNPTLEAQRASLRATDEQIADALSGWRPTVIINADAGLTHIDSEQSNTIGPILSQVSGGLIPPGRKLIPYHENLAPWSASIQAQQNVYDGGRTPARVSAADNNIEAGRAQLRGTEQQVLYSAVQAYIDVLTNEAILELNDKNVQVLQRDLQANQDRFRVGEITQTDVSQSQASLAGAISQRANALSQLDAAREDYQRVVGREPGDLAPPPLVPNLPPSLQEAQAIAVRQNPDLDNARFQEAAARDQIEVAKSQIRPQVSVAGILSRSMNQQLDAQHLDQAEIQAQVQVPIYQSGAEYASIRQAQQNASQALAQISAAQRNVLRSTADAWSDLRAAETVIESSQQQIKANELALQGTRQEQEVGTRTILDVLDAEQALLNSRVSLVQAKGRAYVAAFDLLMALGRLTMEDLRLPTERYDPVRHYEQARARWFGYD